MPEVETWVEEYAALKRGAGVARCNAIQLELTGADRAAFLNRLCTNQVDRLASGQGAETFLTTARGHLVAHALVFARPDALVLRSLGGQAADLVGHLDYYLLHDRVEIHDRSAEWAELLLAGPQAAGLLRSLTGTELPRERLASLSVRIADHTVWIARAEEPPQSVFLISASAAAAERLGSLLHEKGAQPCGEQALEALRIEWGWPVFGRDMDATNLAQEVGRDRRAISLHKGCYLGQETIARIDSRGHVNRRLVRLRFAGQEVPPPGTALLDQGQPVGHVTSAAYSPDAEAALGLGYVRRQHASPGTVLDSPAGRLTVG
jgi:folate-binding protein YgfZ